MKPKNSNRFLLSLRSLLNSSGITLAMALTASPLFAAGGSWNVDAAGNWETAGNWNPAAVPGTAAGDAVNLLFNITAARTVTIGTGVTATVGDLNIGDPTATVFAYTVAAGGTGSIRLDGTAAADATVDFTSNVGNTISAPITLVDNGVIRSNQSTQQVLSGIISGTGKSLTFNNDVDGVTTAQTLSNGVFGLNAANTYNGGTNISDVRVSTNNATGFGTGAVNITGAGQVYVSSAITLANNFTLNSTGWTETGYNFGALRLENGATISGTITLAQNTTVGSFAGTGNLRGVISGAFSLTKTGANTIAINNTSAANTYSGGTTISQGVLSIGTGGTAADTARVDALGTGPVTVNSTGTLQLWIKNNATFTIANNLTVNGGTILNQDGNHTLSGTLAVGASGATLNAVWDGKNMTLSGVVSGSGPVTINSNLSTTAGVLLTNSNTYTGGTTFASGRLTINSGTGLGTGPLAITSTAATSLTIANNAATTVANNISLPAPGTAQNYSIVKNTGGAATGTQLNLTGTISGGGTNATLFLNSNTGGDTTTTYRLAGTNTFAGKVRVNRGGVVVTNSASLGASTNTLELNSNASSLGDLRFENAITLPNPVSLLDAAYPVTISSNGVNAGLSGVLSGPAAFTKVGTGTLTLSGANTATGSTTVSAGTLSLDYTTQDSNKLADAGVLTLGEGAVLNLTSSFATSHLEVVSATNISGNSSISRSGSSANKIALGNINNTGGILNVLADNIATTTTPLTNGLLPGYITVNGGRATKDGFDNIVAYTGYADVDRLGGSIADSPDANVRIIEAGSTGNVALATSGTTTISTLSNTGTIASTLVDVGSGNTLRLSEVGTIQAGTNGLTITNGTLTGGGSDNTAGTLDVINGSATATSISSLITDNGTGVVSLTKSGTGALTLSAANTYTGTTAVNGGTLALAGGSSIADTAAITLANNAGVTLRLDSSETIGSLTSGAASSVNLQANTLTVAGTSSTTASGPIAGTGALVKQGTGVLTLSGVNTYSGGTTLTGGAVTATVNTTQNSLGTGAASIASGTTLTLNNTDVSGSNVTVANTFTGTGLLKLTFAANTTARSTFLSGIGGFTGTIQLSNLGANGDKWGIQGVTTSAALIIDSGSQLYPNGNPSTLSGGITVSGTGNSEARGAIRLATTLGGNITLAGDTTIGAEGGTLTGNITSNAGSAVTLTVGTTNAGAASTFNGIISDGTNPVAVTKAVGSGTMTLAGINTYSGATTLGAGSLNLTGSAANSALSQAATTTLSGEGTVASLTTTGATNLTINAATPGALTASGAFTPGVGAVTTVNIGASTPTSGTVRVLNYGSTSASATNFALAGVTGFRSSSFNVQPTFTDLVLGVANLTWTGTGGTNWDVNTTSNWNDATPAASKFFAADSVTFDDSAAGTAQVIALTTTVQPANITFNNTTDTYSLTGTAGAIIGTTGITKNGTANVTLAGGTSQAYTGPIAVNAGTLTMGSATAFGRTSGITIASGAAVDVNGQTPATVATGGYAYTIAGNGPTGAGAIVNSTATSLASNAGVKSLTLSANASIGGAGRFDFGLANAAGVGTIDGGGFTLTKVGANQIVARGPATNINYVVSAGTLSFEDYDSASGTNSITVNGTGTVGSYGARTIANNVSFATGTTLSNLGGATSIWTGTFTLTGDVNVNTANASINIDGALAGSGNLVRAGGNTLFLQNSSTGFSGKIVNNAGTLRVEGNTALGTATGADVLTLANSSTLQFGTVTAPASGTIGTATQGITQTLGATYDATAGNTLTIDGAITGTGTLTKANNSGHVIFNRSVTTASNTSSNGGTQTFNGNVSLGGAFEVGTNIVSNLNSPVFSSAAMNFWTGTTNIAIGTGTVTLLNVGNATGQSHTINHTAGALTSTGQVLLGHWGGQTSVYNLSGGSFNQPDTVTTNVTRTSEAQANFLIGIDGSGILNVSGSGVLNTSSLIVNGRDNSSNAGQDAVNLTGGRINLGKWGMTTQGTTYAVNLGGGIMGASADWSSSLNMTLTGTGGNVVFNTLDSVDATTARSITLSGTLSGTGGLTKNGAGNLFLTGTKSYTGATNINGGRLYPGASLTTSALSVNTGGTLATGTVAATGTSNITALALNGGDTALRVDYTAGDLINANVFSVPAASTITITPVGDLAPGDTLTLIDYNGTIGGLGFAGLSLTPLPNPHYQASLVDDAVDTKVKVSIDAIDPVVWVGNVNGTWDVDSTSNWKTFSDDQSSKFYTFDRVSFTDEGSATPNVNLVGTVQPFSVTVDSTTDYTFSGVGIAGATGLDKRNTSILTLLNNNTYTGITKVTAGTVKVGNGGTTGTLGGAGNIEVVGTLEFNRSDAQTLARTIISGGTFVKAGTNTVTMSAANNVCNFVVNSGTLAARGGGWATSFAANRTITVNAPGILDTTTHALGGLGGATRPGNIIINEDAIWKLNNEQQLPNTALTLTAGIVNGPGDIRGGGTIASVAHATKSSVINAPINNGNGGVTFDVADGAVAVDLSVTGNMVGGNPNTKTGTGTLVISGNNTYTGGTNANGGVLEVSSIADAGGVGSIGTGYLGIANDGTFRYTGTGTETSARNLWIDTGVQNKTIEVTSATGSITFSGTGGNINKPFTKTGLGALTLADVIDVGATVTVNGGRLSLTGANTYTGDTTVESGTLAVNGSSIADTNKLVINSGKVEPTGTEVVDTLYFGAVQQAAGTWGATGSGATNIDDTRFSGTGVVTVTTGPAGFSSWIGGFGLAVGDQDAGDDPDFDGIANAIEFVLGGNPASGVDTALLPTIELVTTDLGAGSTDYLKFTFRRTDASAIHNPAAQYDTDLAGTWTTAVNGTNGVIVQSTNDFYAPAPNGIDQVIYYIPRSLAAPGSSLFGRLNVTVP